MFRMLMNAISHISSLSIVGITISLVKKRTGERQQVSSVALDTNFYIINACHYGVRPIAEL